VEYALSLCGEVSTVHEKTKKEEYLISGAKAKAYVASGL
jgi:hypothetical protein